MPHLKKTLCATCLLMAMDTSMINPSDNAFAAEQQNQKSSAAEISTPLDDILRYISSGWESLTRSLDNCKTFEDVKTEGIPILYFPEDLPIPPALRELQGRCSIRLKHLPTKIAGHGANNFDSNQTHGLLFLEH